MLERLGINAKEAEKTLMVASSEKKNQALKKIAEGLIENTDKIIEANKVDLENGEKNGMAKSMLDRLKLDKERIEGMAKGVLDVATLPEPVGRILSATERPNGLRIEKVSAHDTPQSLAALRHHGVVGRLLAPRIVLTLGKAAHVRQAHIGGKAARDAISRILAAHNVDRRARAARKLGGRHKRAARLRHSQRHVLAGIESGLDGLQCLGSVELRGYTVNEHAVPPALQRQKPAGASSAGRTSKVLIIMVAHEVDTPAHAKQLPQNAHAGAQICQRTLVTLGFAGVADLAAKGNPLVVDRLPILARQNLEQVLLGLERLFGMRLGTQHQAVRDAVDVRIDRDALDNAKPHVEHDVRRFASHARQLHEFLHVGRYLAAIVGDDHLRGLDGMLGLALIKAKRLDGVCHVSHARPGHGLGRGPLGKQPRCHLVDLRIGRLRREQHRDQQAEGILVVQKALDRAIATVETLAHLNGALALGGIGLAWHNDSSAQRHNKLMGTIVPRPRRLRLQKCAGLAAPQACVLAARLDKLRMRTVLDNLAVRQHHDAVERRHGGQAMCHHNGGASTHQVFERLLHQSLGLAVEGRRRLVEH